MSWFSRKNRDKEEVLRDKESLDRGLEKTKRGLFDRLSRAVAGKSKVDDDVLDAIEDALIASDVGVDTTLKIISSRRKWRRCWMWRERRMPRCSIFPRNLM